MHATLINAAVIGYIAATGLALAYLVQRHDLVHRLSVLAALAGWAVHTVALIVRSLELGGPPLVEDWGSPHFDLIARRQGFWRPEASLILGAHPEGAG